MNDKTIMAELYTSENGSLMRVYDYRPGTSGQEIADDLHETVDGWDYALLTDSDGADAGMAVNGATCASWEASEL